MSFETMQMMMQAMNGSNCTPIVRAPWNDMVIIKRILDIGAHGVIIPWVNTKEDAEYAVRACKYPPEGLRGCGPRRAALFDPDYLKTANDEVLVMVQIETADAVKNVDDILSVKGVDVCWIGHMDLSISMGFGLGRPQWKNPKYLQAFDKVLAAAKKYGKPAGMLASPGEGEGGTMPWALERGFTFFAAGSVDGFLQQGASIALEKAKAILGKAK